MKELALWWAGAKIGLSDVTSGLALIVSLGALWVSWHFGKPSRDLAKISIKEKAAESELASSAILSAKLRKIPGATFLDIRNTGRAPARNITVDLGNDWYADHLLQYSKEEFPHPKLLPGDTMTVLAALQVGGPTFIELTLHWADDSSAAKSDRIRVTVLM